MDPGRRLAEDWVTIWQSEISAAASDPEPPVWVARLAGLWAAQARALINAWPGAHDAAREPAPASSPGTAAAAAAPDPRDAELERLARRIEVLERRLAERDRG